MLYDQMTSRERWDALVRGERLDRVPCLQFMLGHAAVVSGKPIAKVYDDAATGLFCQLSAMEFYGHDGLILHGWANAGGAEFGGEVDALHQIGLRQGLPTVLETAYRHCAHAACPVPAGLIKAIEAAAGLALPRDVAMRIGHEEAS